MVNWESPGNAAFEWMSLARGLPAAVLSSLKYISFSRLNIIFTTCVVRTALPVLWLVPSQSLAAPPQTSFQGHPPLERSRKRFDVVDHWFENLQELEPSGIQVMTHEKRIYPTKVEMKPWSFFQDYEQVLGNMDFSVPPPGFDPTLPPPTGKTFTKSFETHIFPPFRWSPSSWPIRAPTLWRIPSFWWELFFPLKILTRIF